MSSARRLIEIMDLLTTNRATWTPLDAPQTLRMSRASSYRYFLLFAPRGTSRRYPGTVMLSDLESLSSIDKSASPTRVSKWQSTR